jgi:hypothetical protein
MKPQENSLTLMNENYDQNDIHCGGYTKILGPSLGEFVCHCHLLYFFIETQKYKLIGSDSDCGLLGCDAVWSCR